MNRPRPFMTPAPAAARPPANSTARAVLAAGMVLALLTPARAAVTVTDLPFNSRQNAVADPSVENGAWTLEQGAERVSPGRTGNAALRIERTHESQQPGATGTVDRAEPGLWLLSAWHRCRTTRGADRNFSVELRVRWLDARGELIRVSRGIAVSGTRAAWGYREAVVSAPAGTARAELRVEFTGAIVGWCEFDDIALTAAETRSALTEKRGIVLLDLAPASPIFAPDEQVAVRVRLPAGLGPGLPVLCEADLFDSLGNRLAQAQQTAIVPETWHTDLRLPLSAEITSTLPLGEWLRIEARVKHSPDDDAPQTVLAEGECGALVLPRPTDFERRPESPFALLTGHSYTKRWLGARWERPNLVNERLLELPYRYGVCCMPMMSVPHERIHEPGVAEEFARQVTDYVRTNARYLDYLQLGNEPPLFRPGVTENYVRALRIGYEAAKAAKPGLTVAAAGITGLNVDEEMIARFLDAGGAQWCDIIDIHTYLSLAEMDRIVAKVRAQMTERGVHKPLIITEVTAHLGSPIPEREKAGHVYQRYAIALSHGVAQIYWFVMEWVNALPGGFRYCGLFDSANHAPWPAAAAYARLADALEGLAFRRRWVEDGAWVFLFTGRGSSAAIGWSTRPGAVMVLPAPEREVTLVDVNGRQSVIPAARPLRIGLHSEPLLVRFTGGGCEVASDTPQPLLTLPRGTSAPAVFAPADPGRDTTSPEATIRPLTVPPALEASPSPRGRGVSIRALPDAPTGRTEASFLVADGENLRVFRVPIEVTEPFACRIVPIPGGERPAAVRLHFDRAGNIPEQADAFFETTATDDIRPDRKQLSFKEQPDQTRTTAAIVLDAEPDPMAVYRARVNVHVEGVDLLDERANLVFTPAQRCRPAPRIDGNLSEWRSFPVLVNGVSGARRDPEGADPDNPADISAAAAVGWSGDHLYIAVDVTDDVHHNAQRDGALWDGDSVQIGLTADPDNEAAERCECTVALGADGTQVWVTTNLTGRVTGPVDWPAAVVRTDDRHTRYELSVPWEAIAGPESSLSTGTWLGLGLLVNEDDGRGRGWIGWHHGIASDKNPALYGQITLVEEPPQ